MSVMFDYRGLACWEIIVHILIIIIGVIGGVVSTTFAVKNLMDPKTRTFVKPCYIDPR